MKRGSAGLRASVHRTAVRYVPAIRYADMAERVREICARYGQHYNTGSFWSQFATVVARIVKYSFPTWSAAEPAAAG